VLAAAADGQQPGGSVPAEATEPAGELA
jgi:hypothetical protein